MAWRCDPSAGFCGASRIEMVAFGIAAGGSSLFMVVYLFSKLEGYRSAIGDRGRETASEQKIKSMGTSIKSEAYKYLTTWRKYLAASNLVMWVALLAFYTVWPPSSDASDGVRIGACFLGGVFLAATAAYSSLSLSTEIVLRASRATGLGGISEMMKVAFTGGSIVAHINLFPSVLGVSLLYYFMTLGRTQGSQDISVKIQACEALVGFALGANTVAVFSCVAGGIYSSASNTAASIFRQTSMDDDMSHRRNPMFVSTIVGRCISSVAVSSGEAFVSLIASIIAAAILAEGDTVLISIPFWVVGAAIVANVLAFFAVNTNNCGIESSEDLVWALRKGIALSSILVIAFSAIIAGTMTYYVGYGWKVFGCISIGVVARNLIDFTTLWFTSSKYRSVKSITAAGVTGPATVIIQGIGIGMASCFVPALVLFMVILGCYELAGNYGIAMSAIGMISTLGITLSIETIGPLASNVNVIAEAAGLEYNFPRLTNVFEDLGSTVTPSQRGATIATTILSSISLFIAFKHKAEIVEIDFGDGIVMAGVLYGSMLPFLFAALTMLSVQKTANTLVIEGQHQFHIPTVADGSALPKYHKIADIIIVSSLKEMILPGVIALMSPLIVGFLIGPIPLGGMLYGSIVSGVMLSTMMSNSGGAWHNARNRIEIKGAFGGKGTETHDASIVGDDLGNICKDTCVPALNVLIKLMCMMSLMIAPVIKDFKDWEYFYIGIIPIVLCFLTNYIINACGRHNEGGEIVTWAANGNGAANGNRAANGIETPIEEQ